MPLALRQQCGYCSRMPITLEDNFADILGKAQRGLKMSLGELASEAGVSSSQVESVCAGDFSEPVVRKVAPVLGLDADALVDAARQAWSPEPVELDGLAQFTTPFDDITVNAYIIWDPTSRHAAAFDTGADCSAMLDFLETKNLKLDSIFLTHTHGDHIFELDRLKSRTGATAFVSRRERIGGAHPFDEGRRFEIGRLRVETRLTSGHSPGGITYIVTGLARPVAIAGDSIFAGSMGGGMVSYSDALRNNREKILTLQDHTIICPGHGPMTTVGEEKLHNPFFASLTSRGR